MSRLLVFAFGLAAHLMFFGVYAYFIAFVGGFLVPRTIDGPATYGLASALAVNTGLLALFGLQHSIMARQGFKRVWTRVVPRPMERSVYVLISNLLVVLLCWQWRPIEGAVWDIQWAPARWAVWALFASGWLIIPLASFMTNHFDLFGTRQVWAHLRGRSTPPIPFKTRGFYKAVRHPLYVGWIVAFWAAPTMTPGRLLFAAAMTTYILIALRYEERDLVNLYGEKYADYRRTTPRLAPIPRRWRERLGSRAGRPGRSPAPVAATIHAGA